MHPAPKTITQRQHVAYVAQSVSHRPFGLIGRAQRIGRLVQPTYQQTDLVRDQKNRWRLGATRIPPRLFATRTGIGRKVLRRANLSQYRLSFFDSTSRPISSRVALRMAELASWAVIIPASVSPLVQRQYSYRIDLVIDFQFGLPSLLHDAA